ncbi:4Fe-4S binding protein [Saccharopolyspora taberi]|uniref:ferredoxin--NADP(+) reductase n=1 Tax=Saccharopolyspora taberi TaxID=60895 RepID=A0ABN3VAS6_9PSEU
MAFAITQTCCNDASCVSVCPVNCIHPTPDEPEFGSTDMLYIDPRTCIDCGACADACPVDAVRPVDRLRGSDLGYAEMNRQYFDGEPADNSWGPPRFPRSLPSGLTAPRVAVVGTGPAAGYTVQTLLRSTDAEITLIDRVPVPGGLVRFGVAPDHPSTKRIGETFAAGYRHPRVRMHLNVEVGRDVSHDEVAAHHHAVVYAVGASGSRALGVPGEELPGSIPATEFVGWCNALPGVAPGAVDLSSERAVVVGNGNVALDVARILLSDPDALSRTDIADHALAALRTSSVREVVLLGRRGAGNVACTRSELHALQQVPGIEVVVDDVPGAAGDIANADPNSAAALLRGLPVESVDWAAPPAVGKRLVLRFCSAPVEVLGDERMRAVRVGDGAGVRDIRAGLLVRSIGCWGTPVEGLPFDPETGVITNRGGRVGPGTYVVGWAKRGARGGIGANRACAAETVGALLDDVAELPVPRGGAKEFARLVRRRRPDAIGRQEAEAIDRAERLLGERAGRPRVKFATVPDLLRAARSRR